MPDSTDNLLKQIALGEDSMLDASAVPQATLDDLKAPLWRRFRSPLSPKDDREFLSKLKLITCDEEGNWSPTVSGVPWHGTQCLLPTGCQGYSRPAG